MRRKPLLAAAIVALLSTYCFRELHLGGEPLTILLLMGCIGHVACLCVFRWHRFTRLVSGVLLGTYVALHLAPEPLSTVWHSESARCEGRVLRVFGTKGSTMLIDGLVDSKRLPPFACTTMVRWWRANQHIPVGANIVAYGRIEGVSYRPMPLEFNERAWWTSQNVPIGLRVQRNGLTQLSDPSAIQRIVQSIQRKVRSVLNDHLQGASASILSAMITGDRSNIDRDQRAAMAQTGTAHLLAVSGAHVGMILLIVTSMIGNVSSSIVKSLSIVLCVLAFVVFTGASPPALRAMIMLVVAVAGRRVQYDVDALNALGLSVVIELIIWPTLFLNPSFQLSSFATAGILWLTPVYKRTFARCGRKGKLLRWLHGPLSLTIAASSSVAIPSSIIFGTISLFSPLTNLLVVPIFLAGMGAGILTLMVNGVWSELASITAVSADAAISLGLRMIEFIEDIQPVPYKLGVVLVATVWVLCSLWLCFSTTYNGLLKRFIGSVVAVSCACLLPHPVADGVYLQGDGRGLTIAAIVDSRATRFHMVDRNGVVFVRYQYDNRPNPTAR